MELVSFMEFKELSKPLQNCVRAMKHEPWSADVLVIDALTDAKDENAFLLMVSKKLYELSSEVNGVIEMFENI